MKQLIYRQTRGAPFEVAPLEGMDFFFASRPMQLRAVWLPLAGFFGLAGAMKSALKLITGRRYLYGVVAEGDLIHFGWVSRGFCRFYDVDKNSSVIGPIWSSHASRGKGAGTWALKRAINQLITLGERTFYIDTSEDNLPCRKVIQNCCFDTLAGTYQRKSDDTPGSDVGLSSTVLATEKRQRAGSLVERLQSVARAVKMPGWAKAIGRRIVGEEKIQQARWKSEYDAVLAQAQRIPVDETLPKLGIIKDLMLRHSYYEAACLELGIPYKMIDISGADWFAMIEESECAAFAVRPFVLTRVGKGMYDDRVRVLAENIQKPIVPSLSNLWLYESKIRCADWLCAHHVPSPRTWVFYNRLQALEFVSEASYPVVFKLDLGACALGVEIVRDVHRARKLVRRCFAVGMSVPHHDPRDRQWGMVLFQEFIPDAAEWRMIRIGDSFFGHRKLKQGEFHSGSKLKAFDTPPAALLDLTETVSNFGNFKSVTLDILEATDGEYRIIEVQAYFGASQPYQMMVDGVPGRFRRDPDSRIWRFEAGDFTRNAGCNLRLQGLYARLGKPVLG